MKKKTVFLLAVLTTMLASAGAALAFAPAAGQVFYESYQFANGLSTGAGGATVGLGGAVGAGFFLFKQQVFPAVGCALGAFTIANAANAVTAMGFLF